ncbi:MAG: hypothetical protein HYY17_11280, partial [Planctomycetes bacterium]|nr:hypothetical protein [Planctomycetota bacterium]
MAKKTFGALTGDLGRKAGFIREEWGVTTRLKEFDPASLVKEVAAVLAIDASQEGKKGEKTERGQDAREA